MANAADRDPFTVMTTSSYAFPAPVSTLPVLGAQRGVWFADQVAEKASTYVVAHYIVFHGPLDSARLDQAIRWALSEVDTPHARFEDGPDGPLQHVPTSVDAQTLAAITCHDLRSASDPMQAAVAWMHTDIATALPVSEGIPLYRHILFQLTDEDNKNQGECWVWYQRYHHLCVDGYSFAALTRRMAKLYEQLGRAAPISFTPCTPFARVLEEIQQYQESEKKQRDAAFWADYLRDAALPVTLAQRTAETPYANVDVIRTRIEISAAMLAAFNAQLAPTQNIVELMLAAVMAYLARISGQNEQIVGVPFMRRLGSQALLACGTVVNVLPLRVKIDERLSLSELAQRLVFELSRIRKHQRYDAEDLQRALHLVGSGRALYGPTVNLKLYDSCPSFEGLTSSYHTFAAGPVEDLEFGLWVEQETFVIELAAHPERYNPAELALHAERLTTLLADFAQSPNLNVVDAALIGPQEWKQLTESASGVTPSSEAALRSVVTLLDDLAAHQPPVRALVFGDESLNFAALAARVNQLARVLIKRGIGADDIVAIALPRGINSIVSIFAVLATGAAYLPLDLDYPKERLVQLLEDAAPSAMISTGKRPIDLPLCALTLSFDEVAFQQDLAAQSSLPVQDVERRRALSLDSLAYIIYTSGSTGRPKGVMVAMRGLVNLLNGHRAHLFSQATEKINGRRLRVAHSASFSFDASWEPLFCLLLGHELHLCDEILRRDAQAFVEFIKTQMLDIIDVPPSMLQQLFNCGLMDAHQHVPTLVLIGGEAASLSLWQAARQYPQLMVYNLYGPTEYTIDAMQATVASAPEPVIGRPVAATRAYVLNERLQTVPIGVLGELYLAGPGIAWGYLHRPDLTAARFVADPTGTGTLMYRTGDLVRWRSDGLLEYMGRGDQQIKIRGFRVEPAEVVQALERLPGVTRAYVSAEPVGTTHRLVAWCSVADDSQVTPSIRSQQLRAELAQSLPDYMVPAQLELVQDWPLNVNGKVDKTLLPRPTRDVHAAASQHNGLPASATERLLCDAVCQVLTLEMVGVDDDFFHLGGDSISAMALGTVLRRAGWLLRPREIFAQRTVLRMAAALSPLHTQAIVHTTETQGELGKLPIYAWFAAHYGLTRRYAQGMLVKLPRAYDEATLSAALHEIARVHPMLRSRVIDDKIIIEASNHALDTRVLSIEQVAVEKEPIADWIDTCFDAAAQRLAPHTGLVWQATQLQWCDNACLMLVLHHLVVDGVSWRVLLPEIKTAIEAIASGAAPLLARETTSLRERSQELLAALPVRRSEINFWRHTLAASVPLFEPIDTTRDLYGSAQTRRFIVDRALTEALLLRLAPAYRANVEEILLTVAAQALAEVFARNALGVGMESHGRTEMEASSDLSHTVGWLTAEYPVLIEFDSTENAHAAAQVRAVKRALRSVADRGIGYGMLRYLDAEEGPRLAALEATHHPQVLFNYLGRFGQSQDVWQAVAAGRRFADAFAVDLDPSMPMLYPLELNIFVQESMAGPRLVLNWTWAPRLLDLEVIERLEQAMLRHAAGLENAAREDAWRAADTLVAAEIRIGDKPLQEVDLRHFITRYGALQAVLPVLPLQEGLLFHTQLGQAASQYNSITRIDFDAALDRVQTRKALDAVIRRHPQLLTRFDYALKGQPLQLLPLCLGENFWPWREITLSQTTNLEDLNAALNAIEKNELMQDFSIAQPDAPPLLSAVLVDKGPQGHTLLLTAHHLVVDGWSTPILLRDFLQAYSQEEPVLDATRVSYTEVVNALAERNTAAARVAWREVLAGVQPTIVFDTQPLSHDVHEMEIVFPAALASALRARGREYGLTLNTLMQGVWAALLSIMTGAEDVVFGAPVSGRFSPIEGIDEHIGLFSNTLPVRMRFDAKQPLIAQLTHLQAQQIQLLEHDGLGLAEIQRLLGASNLFDTLLVSENYPDETALRRRDYRGARLIGLRNRGYTHYPLTALVLSGEAGIRIVVEYRDVVREPDVLRNRLIRLMEYIAYDPDIAWSAFDPRTETEQALIAAVNKTSVDVPVTTLRDLMIAQAARTPDAQALADVNVQLSYRVMRQQIVALAQRLRDEHVGTGDIVAIALPRSVRLSLALSATMEAGAAYLPLDTAYPDERLRDMVENAQPRCIVTTSTLAARFSVLGQVVIFDALPALAVDAPTQLEHPPTLHADHAAYLLYTSGSTGKPKGVLVSHRAIVNRLLWMQYEYALKNDDVILQKTPSGFDVSVWEFFWPFICGAQLFMAPEDAHRDPEALIRLIDEYRVTTLHFVPSMLSVFLISVEENIAVHTAQCARLRRVFCSGEALPRLLADQHARLLAAPLHNLYGPTEAAVDVTYKPAAAREADMPNTLSVAIGKPVWNTQLRILDAYLRPVPVGVPGELYLCGVQLAHGYLNRAALTAGRFVADPFSQGERMYRTGDVVRWLPTGEVAYLGRSDDQLKIRGQRIELGDIEAALLAQPGVTGAVAHARVLGDIVGVGGDDRQLVAYITASESHQDTTPFRAALAQRLPAHMVPVAIMTVEHFPLSPNGKLNRKALPDPSSVSVESRAPRPGIESHLAAAFARLLNLPTLQAEDDFFALGGHSLLAMRLAAELRRDHDLPVSVGQIMAAPSVAKLAALLADTEAANHPANRGFGEVLHLRSGRGRPLFCIHPASGFAWQYAGLLRYLPAHLPIMGLQSPRPHGVIATSANLDTVCEQHLATLRRLQPQGPYHLLGYSLGGTIAHGMAARLQAEGEQVAFLGLLDTYPPEGQDWNGPTDTEARAEVDREREQFMAVTDADAAVDASEQQEKNAMFADIVANYGDAVRLLSQARSPYFDGEPVLFVATQTLPTGWNPRASWAPFTSSLMCLEFDTTHEDILSSTSLEQLGPALRERLENIDSLA